MGQFVNDLVCLLFIPLFSKDLLNNYYVSGSVLNTSIQQWVNKTESTAHVELYSERKR